MEAYHKTTKSIDKEEFWRVAPRIKLVLGSGWTGLSVLGSISGHCWKSLRSATATLPRGCRDDISYSVDPGGHSTKPSHSHPPGSSSTMSWGSSLLPDSVRAELGDTWVTSPVDQTPTICMAQLFFLKPLHARSCDVCTIRGSHYYKPQGRGSLCPLGSAEAQAKPLFFFKCQESNLSPISVSQVL